MIELINVNKHYMYKGKAVHVLKDVNIRVGKGESVCIRGQSGTGKTTLLNIIGGMLSPSAGTVKVDDTDLTRIPQNFLSAFRRNKVGFIFQQFNLIYNFTVMENLVFPLVPTGKSVKDEKDKIMNLLDRLQIGNRAGFYVNHLSGGEQQRVAIARALVNDPEIIIADEPFSSVDEKNAEFILGIFSELKAKEKTFITASVSSPSDLEKEFIDRDINDY